MGKHLTPWSTKMNQKGDLAAVQVYDLSSSAILDDSVVTSLKHSSKEVLGLAVPDNSWCPTGIPYLYKTNPIPAYTSHHLHDFVVAIVSALVRELLVLLQGIIFSTLIWILLMNFKHFFGFQNHHSLPWVSSNAEISHFHAISVDSMKITHQESRIFHSSYTAYGLKNPPDIQRSFIHVHPSSLSSLAASKYIPRLDPTEVVDPWSGWGNKAQIKFEFTNLEIFGDQWGQEPSIQDPNGDILHTKNTKTTVHFYQTRLVVFEIIILITHTSAKYLGCSWHFSFSVPDGCSNWMILFEDGIALDTNRGRQKPTELWFFMFIQSSHSAFAESREYQSHYPPFKVRNSRSVFTADQTSASLGGNITQLFETSVWSQSPLIFFPSTTWITSLSTPNCRRTVREQKPTNESIRLEFHRTHISIHCIHI